MPAHLGHAPVDSIEPPALLGIKPHERACNFTGDTLPETLQRIRQRLDAVFADAIFRRRCTSDPAAAIRRQMSAAQDRRQRGEFKALPYRGAPPFMVQLRQAEGTAARCLELAVLTAARTAEVLGATWVAPAERMKGGEAHTVHLTSRAAEILRTQLGQHSTWVFPSPVKASAPLSNMAMLTVLDCMGMRDRTAVHGLCRTTSSTWANETGAARSDVIEACLAHEESNRVRAAYDRAQFTQERAALMLAWAGYLSKPVVSNVVPLKVA